MNNLIKFFFNFKLLFSTFLIFTCFCFYLYFSFGKYKSSFELIIDKPPNFSINIFLDKILVNDKKLFLPKIYEFDKDHFLEDRDLKQVYYNIIFNKKKLRKLKSDYNNHSNFKIQKIITRYDEYIYSKDKESYILHVFHNNNFDDTYNSLQTYLKNLTKIRNQNNLEKEFLLFKTNLLDQKNFHSNNMKYFYNLHLDITILENLIFYLENINSNDLDQNFAKHYLKLLNINLKNIRNDLEIYKKLQDSMKAIIDFNLNLYDIDNMKNQLNSDISLRLISNVTNINDFNILKIMKLFVLLIYIYLFILISNSIFNKVAKI